ncbi:hypothetical protein PYJP_01040 [Pyrofollis japonicus]|nr:hypothetical protein PYJP_01040 [Pyrofollis japonicus]
MGVSIVKARDDYVSSPALHYVATTGSRRLAVPDVAYFSIIDEDIGSR